MISVQATRQGINQAVLLHWVFHSLPLFVSLLAAMDTTPTRGTVRVQVLVFALSTLGSSWLWIRDRRNHWRLGWMFFLLGMLVWFALPALYQVATPGIWFGDWIGMWIPEESLSKASLLISLFFFFARVGYGLVGRNSVPVDIGTEPLIAPSYRVRIVIGTFALGLIPYLAFGGSLANVVGGIFAGRTDKAWAVVSAVAYEGNSMMTVFWIARAFLITSGVLGGAYALMRAKAALLERTLHAVIFLIVAVIVYFDQGTRSILAMQILPIVAFYLLDRSRGKYGTSGLILRGLALSIAILILTQVQMYFRTDRTRSTLTDLSLSQIVASRQQTDFFTEAATAVVVRDSILKEDLRESPLLFFVVNPIPRVLWPSKPLPQAMWHYSLYRWGIDIWEKGGNALPSVVGQYYITWGIPGVAWVGLFYGLAVGWLEKKLLSRGLVEYCLLLGSAATFLFLSFRYLFPGFHYSTVALFVVLVAYRLVRRQTENSQLRAPSGLRFVDSTD